MKTDKKKISISDITVLKKAFFERGLNTVCQSAKCPNIGECYKRRTATFLILGKNCTRGCKFCGIDRQNPQQVDGCEPARLAQAVKMLALKYCVITSVTRDDLEDGGAGHFASTIREIRKLNPECLTEVLVPDFKGDENAVDIVLSEKPEVFSHNIETVPSLYSKVRSGADYGRSLKVLKYAKSKGFRVKTGIMLGLGEEEKEIVQTLKDIKDAGVDMVTIGQYLAPTIKHYPVIREYTEEEFKKIKEIALSAGIKTAVSGRYVRSSYLAEEYFKENF